LFVLLDSNRYNYFGFGHIRINFMDQMLKDRVAIVTGAGRGVGRATAKLFSQEGAKVVACDLDEGPCQETAISINAAGGISIPCVGDLTTEGFPERLISTTVESFGQSIDIIVNNAGYSGSEFIHKATNTFWQEMFEIHSTAPFKIIRAACPFMRDQAKMEIDSGKNSKCRKIINVSSLAATDGIVAGAAYSSAKAALLGFTKSLAKEFGPYNICVNAIALGFIDTRLTQPLEKKRSKAAIDSRVLGFDKKALEEFISLTSLKRIGTVEEAAGAILLLASSLSNYITGQVIKVSGGLW